MIGNSIIYSNLSLQVLKLKDLEILYDEYFNFDVDTNAKLHVCIVIQSIKPLNDQDIFLNFLKKIIKSKQKIVFISDDISYLKRITSSINSSILFFEFPMCIFAPNNISIKNLFKFQFPFDRVISQKLKNFISNVIHSLNMPKVKNICLDFDNTLWGGIVGNENSLENQFERSSSSFLFFQNKLKNLRKKGVLLCLVTKNNRSDIDLFFEKNKSMPLKLNDFVIIKSNWENKSNNILEISSELNINTDTFLFFDDSDFELEEVKLKIPNIRTFKVTTDSLFSQIHLIPEFQEINSRLNFTDKTEDYKKEFVRKNQLSNDAEINDTYNINAFNRLKIKLDFKIKDVDVNRISEMSEKTNQFNFNKKNLSQAEIKNLIKLNNMFITCAASDKYGDYGIIGYAHINTQNQIENFVMSCRALSRGIEFKFIEFIINHLRLKKIVLKFKKTQRNTPSKIFLQKNKKFPQEIINID